MTIKEAKENNCILVDCNGKPLTEIEIEFLDLMKKIQEKYGSGVVLAIRTIMEALIK